MELTHEEGKKHNMQKYAISSSYWYLCSKSKMKLWSIM